MKKIVVLGALAFCFSTHADMDKKTHLGHMMIHDCMAEMKMDPVAMDLKDTEAVWKNLEAKEEAGKLSAKCDKAEGAYEKEMHPDVYKAEEAKEQKK